MASKASALLLLLPFLFVAAASAFNITNILNQFSDFSNFNSILSQTHLAEEINSRTTITVLAVDSGALGAISGLPIDVQKRILSVHVVLDYYDTIKFKDLKKSSSVLTTLFQTTGSADQRQGFLNMTKANGQVVFGSAMPGSPLNANFVKTILTRPYNISVLQVSGVIVPPGITSLNITTPPPPPAAVNAPAPAPAKREKPAGPPVEAPTADAPAEADAPTADAPVAADAPEADAPVAADAPTPSAKDAADAPEDDEKSGAGRVVVGAGFGAAMMGAVLLGL